MAEFEFEARARVPVPDGGRDLDLRLTVASDGALGIELFGRRLEFQAGEDGFAALFDADASGEELIIDLASALAAVGIKDAPGADAIPALHIRRAALIRRKNAEEGAAPGVAMILQLGVALDLHDLPLVGDAFAKGAYGLDDLTFAYATEELGLIESSDGPGSRFLEGLDLGKGASLSGRLKTGSGEGTPIGAPPASPSAAAAAPGGGAPPADNPADPTKWVKVGKSLGPVTIHRVGFRFSDGVATLPVDLAMAAGPLRLDLMGAGLGVSFEKSTAPVRNVGDALGQLHFHPTLDGIGIAFKNPPVGISGALLRVPSKGVRFDGAITVQASKFSIAAFGSYEKIGDADPSFFVFGVLNAELGGPPIFRVTGLAAGFGINRSFDPGPVEHVADNPLVAFATATEPMTAADALQTLSPKIDTYLAPKPGALWFSIGVKGNSFGLIDTFLMLTLALGEDVSISLLGLSTLVLPPQLPHGAASENVPPIAKVVLQVKAEVAPSAGTISLEARIAGGSYVFSPDCHLTGGFAFKTWFKGPHAGDFAITLGGWHRDFSPPSHYPTVPRVALDWAVTRDLAVHGELYFGLTPSCVMAGGALSARYSRGHLSAWFDLTADFLMDWEPFHYSIHVSVRLGARYVATIDWGIFGTSRTPVSINLAVGVDIWGPSFGGTAHVEWLVISFTIDFGADKAPPPTMRWETVKEKFLPALDDFIGVAVTDGLLAEVERAGRKVQVMSPKAAAMELRAPTPLTSYASGGGGEIGCYSGAPLGVRPIGKKDPKGWRSRLDYSVRRAGGDDITDQFAVSLLTSGVPAALWGDQNPPKRPSADVIPDVTTGVALALKPQADRGADFAVPIEVYKSQPIDKSIGWDTAASPPAPLSGQARAAARRRGLDFGPDASFLAIAAEIFPDVAGDDVVQDIDLLQDVAGFAFQAMPDAQTVGAPLRQIRPQGG